jgi:hypothetical protein
MMTVFVTNDDQLPAAAAAAAAAMSGNRHRVVGATAQTSTHLIMTLPRRPCWSLPAKPANASSWLLLDRNQGGW